MKILEQLIAIIIGIISFLGYWGIFILMTLESMIAPVPSEAVMPFAGYLVTTGRFSLWLVVFVATVGSIVGSLISYYVGYYGGKPFVLKFGKYLLLDECHLNWTEKWFKKRGAKTIFISRFIPVVRHLISIPAGIGKMNLKKFCVYTFTGAFAWNFILTYAGVLLGKNWERIHDYSSNIDIVILVLIVAGIVYYIYSFFKKRNNKSEKPKRKP